MPKTQFTTSAVPTSTNPTPTAEVKPVGILTSTNCSLMYNPVDGSFFEQDEKGDCMTLTFPEAVHLAGFLEEAVLRLGIDASGTIDGILIWNRLLEERVR